MWNSTKITQLLGIEYPILQGPMGVGFSTPALLASVSNAGGLGSYGAYTLTPEEILEADKTIKAATSKPYNINLWVNDTDKKLLNYPKTKIEEIKMLFKPYFDELGIELPNLSADIRSKFEKQVEVLFEIKPAVFSFIFGIPSKEILAESRRLGIKTVGAATTLEEALALEEAKVDAIVAAGFEAGGHRPSFLKPAQESFTGLFTLIQQLKAKTKTPIIAAGGIIDAKGIAAALTLGADAVQIGTAFMVTEESGATPIHKEVLFSGTANPTTISKSLTGRMGRMVSNTISDNVPFETEVLPFPLQTKLIAPLRVAALAQGRTDLISFWSGQNNTNLKHHKASELMQELITETGKIIS
ncbi:NAD(P)H-dependent flavin oxidoreductase [Flavobacterium reichenbachii]|uniref:2-nitropropane dioxygenase n=1 Tax=Flavobacterium reichenbachii TaxID=362418 RepID=A0A085ZF37_9FLAO|nr:nitronate monooxygenase [Flavobacterium reichenbachii]KFF03051.1 2-nitropropane dioxygenase [Flavobacterium reichenbachii]OXB17196.1 2-nitropropane dioxygenase [Flavobacterium reichenbachii]